MRSAHFLEAQIWGHPSTLVTNRKQVVCLTWRALGILVRKYLVDKSSWKKRFLSWILKKKKKNAHRWETLKKILVRKSQYVMKSFESQAKVFFRLWFSKEWETLYCQVAVRWELDSEKHPGALWQQWFRNPIVWLALPSDCRMLVEDDIWERYA